MRRIDVRTPTAWRSFDLWSGIIALLIPLALACLWLARITPPIASCCGAGARAPVTALPVQRVNSDVESKSRPEQAEQFKRF
jgi:hypothetical protein